MKEEPKEKRLIRYWVHKALFCGAYYVGPYSSSYAEHPKWFKEILQELIDNDKMRLGYLNDEYMYGFKTKGKHGASS
jgi:hypothetical protein